MNKSAAASRVRLFIVTALLLGPLMTCRAGTSGADADPAWGALRDGAIVLMRHAEAPGIGDPTGFKLGDCSTQRNLDEQGRAQARRIGEAFRRHGVKIGAVVSSQWCRTHETAELAFPGQVRDDARVNSFFGDTGRETVQTRAALAFLHEWHGPGVLVIVTHQVNITALTGVVPSSGEGVIVRATNDAGGVIVVGRLHSASP